MIAQTARLVIMAFQGGREVISLGQGISILSSSQSSFCHPFLTSGSCILSVIFPPVGDPDGRPEVLQLLVGDPPVLRRKIHKAEIVGIY